MIPANLRQAAVPAYLFLCLTLGGASAAGIAANLFLQIAGLGIIAWACISRQPTVADRLSRALDAIVLWALGLILMQLVPLPPSVWQALPGRSTVSKGLGDLGIEPGWMPISLNPSETVASAIWLIPAVATLLGITRLGAFRLSWLIYAILAATILSVFLGAVQLAGGPPSAAYLYEISNRGVAVGFFSNANHFATLLICSLPFIVAYYLTATKGRRRQSRRTAAKVVSGAALLATVVGVVINGSLAGIGLLVPTVVASALLIWSQRRNVVRIALPAIALLVIASGTLILFGPFGNNLIGAEAEGSSSSRLVTFARTYDAAIDFAPIGSGIGTFEEVYRSNEDPDLVDRYFMNATHNDYLQLALETGLPGILLIAAFLAWWARRSITLWSVDNSDLASRAAMIASGAVLVHSIVDYPLRTAAISALFACCVALMQKPRQFEKSSRSGAEPDAVHLSAG